MSVTRGTVGYYASSPGVRRGFYSRCGTALSYENRRWAGDIHLMVGAFEAPETLKPQFHVFAQERLPWLHLDDGLPRYRTTPSAGEMMEYARADTAFFPAPVKGAGISNVGSRSTTRFLPPW